MLRCKFFGHDGPYWLDYQHQGHCRRCRAPHPQWLRFQETDAMFAALREAKAEAWNEGWMSGLRDAHDHDSQSLPEPNPYRD